MITLRKGSHVHNLLLVLSAVGEFPASSLHLLGSRHHLEARVRELESVQRFRSGDGADLGSFKLLNVSGRSGRRTVRLYRGALPLLGTLHPKALESYMSLTNGHRFSGNDAHVIRSHRVAETVAVCLGAGIEFRQYILPPMQKTNIECRVPAVPCFYAAKSLKRLDNSEMNKTMFTRLTGALFAHGTCFAIYNTRDAVMKWSGMGEFKTVQQLTELGRMNAGIQTVDRALLLGGSMRVALETVRRSDESKRLDMSFDRIYPHIHFIPLNGDGIRLLKLLTLPNWNGALLSALFPDEWRAGSPGSIEYDAKRGETFILSHLDGDIARLMRLKLSLEQRRVPVEIVCFPWQSDFLSEYMEGKAMLRGISVDAVEKELGISVEDDDEK